MEGHVQTKRVWRFVSHGSTIHLPRTMSGTIPFVGLVLGRCLLSHRTFHTFYNNIHIYSLTFETSAIPSASPIDSPSTFIYSIHENDISQPLRLVRRSTSH